MVFAWDENKNRSNQRKHGVSFDIAAQVFRDERAVSYVDSHVDGEERWHTVGTVDAIQILLVVHTAEGENDEEEIRIISARKANARERALYNTAH